MKTFAQLPPLTTAQLEIINGSLLGDASIIHNDINTRKNGAFSKGQSCLDILGVDKMQYMQWHANKLAPYSGKAINRSVSFYKIINNSELRKPVNVKTSSVQSTKYTFITRYHPVFTTMARKWYANDVNGYIRVNGRRIKIVPNDIKLTPLTLCVWHMDDGYANAKDANILLNTQGFTWEECEFLSERLKSDLDITSKVRAKNDKPIIYVPRESYFDFIDMIKPYVEWDCFQYKIDSDTYNKKPQIGETHSQAKFTDKKIKLMVQLNRQGWTHEALSKKFRTAKANVSLILSGSHWSHVTGIQFKPVKPRVGKETKQKIVDLAKKGISQQEIACQLKVHQSTVSRTIKGAICQTLEA